MPNFKMRRVGRTTLELTELGFGSATIAGMNGTFVSPEQSTAIVGAALDAGIGYFDSAPHYGFGRAEHVLGMRCASAPNLTRSRPRSGAC